MHITKIELEDIKSHREAKFEFRRGTTAITGANGAGKTTLIEAVAWTLFDLLDYKKDDFVRRGAKKGVARVTFESGLDGREYVVYRDTGTGYNIYDPQLKMRIADKKEEVSRFLWTHLGVEAGTDLESLFRRAIGVPQGTFTAIFLETPTERKKAFDKLLKVEEYRQGAEKLRETARFIEQKITIVREKIARAEGELARLESVENDLKNFAAQVSELNEIVGKTEKEVSEKNKSVKEFDATESKVNELKSAFEKLSNEKTKAEILLTQKESELNQAKSASEKIKTVEADYNLHLQASEKLKELERERIERDKLTAQKTKIETSATNVETEKKRLAEDLERAQKAHREIAALKPQVVEQEDFERKREILRDEFAKANAVENQIKSLEEKMVDLRKKYKANQDQIKEAETRTSDAESFENLTKRDAELTNMLANLRAKLDADEKFQREIKNGLCPILSEKCLNLKEGQTLESFISTQFSEVKTQISALETEQKTLAVGLKNSREAEKFAAQLETLRSREKEIGEEGKGYRSEQDALKKQLENLPQLKNDFAEIEVKIKVLDNPKAKLSVAENEAKREIEIQEKITAADKNLERLNSDRLIIEEQIEKYKMLDENWKIFTEQRDTTVAAHREFLVNEAFAKLLPERETEFSTAQKELKHLAENVSKAEKDFETANKDYDRERHQAEKFALGEAEKRFAETRANLAHAEKRKTESEVELNRLSEIRKAMQSEFKEKERLEKVAETTDFIRVTLKEAAPRVARNYVYHVSLEAGQMFREISGNAERTLKWTEDYGIILEENGYERPFINLSGGEQMAAALSVRLALLKQLSDVRLAFFDEPTTNMDAARRERLAEQISHITAKQTFDQLFVISHDDTFEGYVDNVVSIEENGNE